MPNHVLDLDCTSGAAYAEVDFGSDIPDLWIEFDVAFDATFITALLAAADPTDAPICGFSVHAFLGLHGGVLKWKCGADSPFTPAAAITALQFYHIKLHYQSGLPQTDMWVDGTLVGSDTSTTFTAQFFDLFCDFTASGGDVYYDNFTAGTTDGGTELGSDDFEGDLSYWNDGTFNASIIADPGIAPPGGGPPPPPPPPQLTIRIYDLGTTVLADITSICLLKNLGRELNGPRSFIVTLPANNALLTAIAGDGFPILDDGGDRKLVVWEDADPDTEDPIFHGRIFKVERSGDENAVQVTVTAYDPRMELGYDADDRAGRIVRDSTGNFIDPTFTSSVPGQAEISGPDLIKQVLTYAQADPTTDPVTGEGPLPIDLQSGVWDLAVPPALDVNPVDSADWPVMVGDFVNQLVATDAVDFDLRPIRPGTGLNLAGDPDPYIMVEASSKSKIGTDRSGTVHFDYLTGAKNAMAARADNDFSTVCDRLWYFLGPRLDKSHWRGDITPHSASVADLLALMDAAADRYGGPDTPPGYNAWLRVFDSLGTENSSRPLYLALYRSELRLRLKPRLLLYVTPSPAEKALFQPPQDYDAYDVVRIKTGPGFGVELDEAQRVYGYTKTWSAEGVATVSELKTSADV